MTRLVIFDLDGTLLNTIADLGTACNYALRCHGFPLREADEYPHLVGNGVNKLIERALPDGHKDEATVLRLKADFITYYNEHNRIATKPYEGIPEALNTLKQRDIRIAVASNKYHAATTALTEHYFGRNTFDIILGEREGVPRKPDPQIVFDILRSDCCQGIHSSEVLYIGDSDVDMATAHNAGIESIACSWGFCTPEKLAACQPDHLIRAPFEILTFIR